MRRNRWKEAVMDFFFPRRCPFCGKVVGRELLCGECSHTLPYTKERAVAEGPFGRCASPVYYEEEVRRALLELKFQGKTGGMDCFAMLMAQCAAEHFAGAFDAVTWVPVSEKRRRKRGYDQARCLADGLCRLWDIQAVETLRKVTDTPPQSSLSSPEARRANVLGVYEACREQVCGRRLLLVDDILTTGATLGECVRVLREAGAADVLCLTLARSEERAHSPAASAHNSKVHESRRGFVNKG